MYIHHHRFTYIIVPTKSCPKVNNNIFSLQVLKEVQKDLVHYPGADISVMEMSHRGSHYAAIHEAALQSLKDIIYIPDNYKILLMQGGGTGLFATVCMNLMGRTGTADYIVSGSWSAKAAKEAEKYGKVNLVIPKTSKYTSIPDQSTWNLDPNASYVYYCDNETVDGKIELRKIIRGV